ncbi:MAG: DUF3299 domain-containing protein [Gammaproteobacteria bacterium]|nr:DUF3299 domain-containing protein [Gammaproteobacteria bacterium]
MKPQRLVIRLAVICFVFVVWGGQNALQAIQPKQETETSQKQSSGRSVTELEWEALIPSDWRFDQIIGKYNIADLSDDDPRAAELMEKLQTLWKEAPVVHDLDGKTVKLPGFVVPLEMDAQAIREFLLVPYYGACIHTPPPPANQIIHVVTEPNRAYKGRLFDTVWVTGMITVERSSSELGEAGYRIEAHKIEPYQ